MFWRLKRTKHLIVLAVSLAVASATTATADILHVPGDFPTIQEAIDAAVDGDEVEVHPGTYNETINLLGKTITVRSSDGPEVTIIDAQQTGTVVTCNSGEGPDTVLEGFTITGGTGTDPGGGDLVGGGMYNSGSSPTVANCTFSGNGAGFGGGMINASGSNPTVTGCTFNNNLAGVAGGGMFNSSSSPTVTNCTFTENFTGPGGVGGGMINASGSNPTVTGCTFNNNLAGVAGGGMVNSSESNPTVTNCTFTANSAGGGGGMYNRSSSPTVTNCTFSGNTAFGGGGMYNLFGSSPTVINCILWGDMPDEINNVDPDSDHPIVSFSDVQGGLPPGTIDGGGNIDADPLFVDPDNDDYHISPTSPCIDAADNTAVPKGIVVDLDGEDRFVDDPDTPDTGNGDPPIVDMGAYEFQADETPPCPADLDGSGDVGVKDLLILLGAWGPCPPKGDCPADFDDSGDVGVKDLLFLLGNWGPCPK